MKRMPDDTLVTQIALLQWQVAQLTRMVYRGRRTGDIKDFIPKGAAAEMLFGKDKPNPKELSIKLRRVAMQIGAKLNGV